MGQQIDKDVAQLGDRNCWNAQVPEREWSELDAQSTQQALPTTTTNYNILRNVIHNKNAQDPAHVSYLYNLISFKGCNSDGPDTQYRIRGGSQAIPIRIAERLLQDDNDSELLLNSPVTSI